MPCLGGIDVGLTLLARSSGICRTGDGGFLVDHTYSDLLSRERAFALRDASFDVLAIDGPVLPPGVLHYSERAFEKVFVWRPFQKRCKPGESHCGRTGTALRRGGCDTAGQWARRVLGTECGSDIPRVHPGRNIVEAFPNAFLGVMLPDTAYSATIPRERKFDALYDACCADGTWDRLSNRLGWDDSALWAALKAEQHHDRRAALVCVLTALAAWRGKYVAVGDATGGYFFLPPWELWTGWARRGLDANRRDARLRDAVDVWINGRRFTAPDVLPHGQ